MLVASGDALIGLYFEAHTYPPAADLIGQLTSTTGDSVLTQAESELREYLRGERQSFDVKISTSGDEFSERVWQKLLEIPFGETTTYGAIAAELGSTGLAQRVGQSVGHNPLCIFIPCHRVLGANGQLTGYAGGLDRKRTLLAIEEPSPQSAGRLF